VRQGRRADWDAATYDRVSDPQVEWARAVLDRLPLRGDETVLDAGCGSGRVTRMLADRLPAGRVIGVDASPSMVERARSALRPQDTVVRADLSELELEEPVDAVFSNAVFHWISDHDTLFRRLHAAMRPGGRLIAQCGGEGNVDFLRAAARDLAAAEPYARHLQPLPEPWNYAGPGETARRLEASGFDRVETSLDPWPVTPPEPLVYLSLVCLSPYLERLPEELHDDFVAAVAERLGRPLTLDHVRLDISARRMP
jgi:trans-aconitate 2-methyltransferase